MPRFKKRSELVQERGTLCTNIPKSELCGFKWANNYNKCVHESMSQFATKPMSYVAALHLYQIKLGSKLIRPLRLL